MTSRNVYFYRHEVNSDAEFVAQTMRWLNISAHPERIYVRVCNGRLDALLFSEQGKILQPKPGHTYIQAIGYCFSNFC